MKSFRTKFCKYFREKSSIQGTIFEDFSPQGVYLLSTPPEYSGFARNDKFVNIT